MNENLYLKSPLSGSKIEINAFIRNGLNEGGGRGAYTWSNTSVKQKVGLSAGGMHGGLKVDKYGIY